MDNLSKQKKKEAQEKADKITSRLAVETVDETTLIQYVNAIEQYHYEEIVEERFLSKICGYSICPNELKDIPTKKYQISVKHNKVYEMSDRKRYCSTECYKASKYLEAQISKEPIWMRNTIQDNFNIRLWSKEIKKESTKKSETIAPKNSTNISNLIEDELKEIEHQWENKFKISSTNSFHTENQLKLEDLPMPQSIVINNSIQNEKMNTMSEILEKKFIASIDIHKMPTELKVLKEIFELDMSKKETTKKNKEFLEVNETVFKRLLFIEYIIQRMTDLLSKRTQNFLKEKDFDEVHKLNQEREREEYLKKCETYVMKSDILFSNLTNDSDMSSFKLNENVRTEDDNGEAEMLAKLQSFTEKEELKNNLHENIEKVSNDAEFKQPLPDYKQLKEEALKNQIKVSEFFRGFTKKEKNDEILEEIDNSDMQSYNTNLIFKVKHTNEEIARILPHVDNQSQMEIRRNIFFEKLLKYMEQVLRFNDLKFTVILDKIKNHLKNFVFSLNLTSENLIFNSNEWPIVALFVLQLLSLKPSLADRGFESLISNDKLLATLLKSYGLDQNKLKLICIYLINN